MTCVMCELYRAERERWLIFALEAGIRRNPS